ncbi:MAG: hypothetical protein H6576_04840 [Lewinellaceae bacterium]|nr:hypothetical protein [Saprospiraceae bacterium]MCB9342997.1 hypothetical protein [Lewinellaceae bacterium]
MSDIHTFRDLHQTKPIHVDVLNISNPDALPAPLVVTRKQADDLQENKLLLRLTNVGSERLILGGPPDKRGQNSGIYVDLSDLMDEPHLNRISVFIDGCPVQASPIMPLWDLLNPDGSKLPDNPFVAPGPNPDHLSKEYFILYIWPENELFLGIGATITIQLENVVSEFYPALRYLDVSWELRRDTLESEEILPTVQGFCQLTMELRRPPGFVEPPLPLQVAWLNGQNTIYSSVKTNEKDLGTQAVKNELSFCISNTGLKPFVLDCSKHSRGVPYFELEMVSVPDGEKGNMTSAIANAKELVNAELAVTEESKATDVKWKVNKFIQGPTVKWEIRPDLELKKEGLKSDKKVILGTKMEATVTFTISNLITKLQPGVGLVYFRFYNMPEHDDGQLVLFLEKRNMDEAVHLVPQLQNGGNSLASPFYWSVEEKDKGFLTQVHIGEEKYKQGLKMKVHGDLEVEGDLTADEIISKNGILGINSNMKINGATEIDGITKINDATEFNGLTLIKPKIHESERKKEGVYEFNAKLKLMGIGVYPTFDSEHHASIEASPEGHNGTKIIFSSSEDNGVTEKQKMVIKNNGYVGIGVNEPTAALHIGGDGRIVVAPDRKVYEKQVKNAGITLCAKDSDEGKDNIYRYAYITAKMDPKIKGKACILEIKTHGKSYPNNPSIIIDSKGNIELNGNVTINGDVKIKEVVNNKENYVSIKERLNIK